MSKTPMRLSLARLPTPLWTVAGLPRGPFGDLPILVKRDDLTGAALSGNKVRKLEYLLAEAKARGARRVLTTGAIQSNHCRATAIAARQLGLGSLLFLRVPDTPPPAGLETGNLRLARLVGAEVRFITPAQYEHRDALLAEAARDGDYVIPEGGSNALGSYGYVAAAEELAAQWDASPTAILCATGSGGTLAGLTMGVRRLGLDIPVFGIVVGGTAEAFRLRVAAISQEAHARWPELPALAPADVLAIDGWAGLGYALSTAEEQADLTAVARATGLILDPVYTAKAFRALLHDPARFGERPLFVHTGGIFGLLA
jgi:D-cysteine desulfhydrase